MDNSLFNIALGEKIKIIMRRKIKLSYNAPVVLSFVLACLFVTLLGLITKDKSTALLFSVYRGSWINPLTYIRLFTHVLGHSGFEHFISNAMYLLLLGPMLEEKYGSKLILKVLFITALVTGTIHCIFMANTALCGASGVVFAFILLSSFTAFREGEIPLSFILVVLLFIGREVYDGVMIQDNISNLTHIIGGGVGSVMGFLLNKKPRGR